MLPDGLYRVENSNLCAGFVIEGSKVVQCAPILRKRLDYWMTVAEEVPSGPSARLLVIEQVVSCTSCELHEKCTAPVAMSGPTGAQIAVVGEAPGKTEDEQGAPFVGPAGQMIRKHLDEIGIDPEHVVFVNTVSCFPNATPTPAQVDACAHNKRTQLDFVAPIWVLVLGKIALKGFRPHLEIGRARGRAFLDSERVCYATYHPAAALRNRLLERGMREDLDVFAEMVRAGRDRWVDFTSDKCVLCAESMFWMDPDGLTYCRKHMPDAGREREAFLAADMAATRARA